MGQMLSSVLLSAYVNTSGSYVNSTSAFTAAKPGAFTSYTTVICFVEASYDFTDSPNTFEVTLTVSLSSAGFSVV